MDDVTPRLTSLPSRAGQSKLDSAEDDDLKKKSNWMSSEVRVERVGMGGAGGEYDQNILQEIPKSLTVI